MEDWTWTVIMLAWTSLCLTGSLVLRIMYARWDD